jgi:type IV secretion system protein VirB8
MLIRYFLNQYVMAREGFRREFYEYDYNTLVRLLSSSGVYMAFYQSIAPETPGSPVSLGPGYYREVKIKSIVFIAPKRAQIRIQIQQFSPMGGDGAWIKHYILTVDFDFFPLELSLKDRYTNPLGFQVTNYRKDEDAAK